MSVFVLLLNLLALLEDKSTYADLLSACCRSPQVSVYILLYTSSVSPHSVPAASASTKGDEIPKGRVRRLRAEVVPVHVARYSSSKAAVK